MLFYLGALVVCGAVSCVRAEIIDNRYIPYYTYNNTWLNSRSSAAQVAPFYIQASEGYGLMQNSVPLNEIYGVYDQQGLSSIAYAVCGSNPLRSDLQDIGPIPWQVNQKLTGGGVEFMGELALFDSGFLIGAWISALHVHMRTEYQLSSAFKRAIKPSQTLIDELDEERRAIHDCFGINSGQFSQGGVSDLDLWVGYHHAWWYTLLMKRIELYTRIGTWAPTAPTMPTDNPGAIPLGGNGHWGFYGLAEGIFELKDDIVFTLWLQVAKRLARHDIMRLSVAGEPQPFGGVEGLVMIDPGVTVGVSPALYLGGIGNNLGFMVSYSVVMHQQDCWSDPEPDIPVLSVDLNSIMSRTSWRAEYWSVQFIYDCAAGQPDGTPAPLIFFVWDIPSSALGVARLVSKTNRISLGITYTW